ncbi:cytochrome P450 [Celeribacter sp.]|uniref:cytochrome P450 n=1 Tax=Celeribacter sp. TaxID=1890673 RepID=UPI003A914A5A
MKSVSQDIKDPAFVENPYAFYDQLRAMGGLVHWEEIGHGVVASHDGVAMALRDNRLGREAPEGFAPDIPPTLKTFYEIDAHSMLELEGDAHRRLRGLVLRAFTSRRIKGFQPEIEAICDDLLDGLAATFEESGSDSPVNLLDHFCKPLPVRVIARLLGVPEEMCDQLLAWSNAMVAVYTPNADRATQDAAEAAAIAFSDFMRAYVDARRDDPRDDLITHLIAAETEGEKLTTEELITTCILLLNAGHEATVHSLGIAVKTLLEHDTDRTLIHGEGIDALIEEVLRYDPPLHLFNRWVYEDMEFQGTQLKRGDRIGLLLAAAGRDGEAWDDPDRFIPTRPIKQNAAFGAGIHFCVGAPLARLELRVALPRLFARFPELSLAEPPVYADTWHFHGLSQLMVKTR